MYPLPPTLLRDRQIASWWLNNATVLAPMLEEGHFVAHSLPRGHGVRRMGGGGHSPPKVERSLPPGKADGNAFGVGVRVGM